MRLLQRCMGFPGARGVCSRRVRTLRLRIAAEERDLRFAAVPHGPVTPQCEPCAPCASNGGKWPPAAAAQRVARMSSANDRAAGEPIAAHRASMPRGPDWSRACACCAKPLPSVELRLLRKGDQSAIRCRKASICCHDACASRRAGALHENILDCSRQICAADLVRIV